MPDIHTIFKKPAEVLPPPVDFADQLAQIHDDEEIASVEVSAIDLLDDSPASEILDGSAVIVTGDRPNSRVLQPIAGGLDGEKYKLTFLVTTNNSNSLDNAPVLEANIEVHVQVGVDESLHKEPNEIIPPTIEFITRLEAIHADEEIASAVVSAIDLSDDSDASEILDGDPIVGNGDGVNSRVMQSITGGVDGEKYKLTFLVTTNNSNSFENAQVLQADIELHIEDS